MKAEHKSADGLPGANGAPGEEGPPGEVIEPTASFGVVQPMSGPLDRVVRVELLLEELEVDDSTSVDFGQGIGVVGVTVTGRSSLALNLAIRVNENLISGNIEGERTLTIRHGGQTAPLQFTLYLMESK